MSEPQRRDSSKDRIVSEDLKKPVWSTEEVLMTYWDQAKRTEAEARRKERTREKQFLEKKEDTRVLCMLDLAWCCQS